MNMYYLGRQTTSILITEKGHRVGPSGRPAPVEGLYKLGGVGRGGHLTFLPVSATDHFNSSLFPLPSPHSLRSGFFAQPLDYLLYGTQIGLAGA